MGVTIKDVAEAAGVSISTVSKVLNGHYSISEKKMAQVNRLGQVTKVYVLAITNCTMIMCLMKWKYVDSCN